MPGRRLDDADRELISRGLAMEATFAAIARSIDRPTSTVSREVNRCGGRSGYRAVWATRTSSGRARRPKVRRLVADAALALWVSDRLMRRWSPQQIAGRLRIDYPDTPDWHVSHETIYQALYLQGRGGLRAELTDALRTGRARRRPKGSNPGRGINGKIRDMVNIADRPAEIEDRAVPGHWEGDLVVGKANRSQVATLVERSSRFTMLVHLPGDRKAATVAAALSETITGLPPALVRTLTWDQGKELAAHANFSVATGVPVFFCDPHSPWQRGTNENTNGLLRQYLPKGTDLSVHSTQHLQTIADELNGRPRQTLGFKTPSEALADLLVATTT